MLTRYIILNAFLQPQKCSTLLGKGKTVDVTKGDNDDDAAKR